jgi:hypothetical protein
VKAERESLKPDCRSASAILAGPRESLLRALPQSSSDIMQKGLDFVREQSGTVTPPDPGVPRDPAPPAAWPKVELPALETETGRMGSLAFKYLHGGQ